MILRRVCGHMVICNTAALRALGITADTPQPVQGEFEIEDVNIIVNKEAPLIISRFVNDGGQVKYVIVNNDREKSVKAKFFYKGNYSEAQVNRMQLPDLWLGAGQMAVIDIL